MLLENDLAFVCRWHHLRRARADRDRDRDRRINERSPARSETCQTIVFDSKICAMNFVKKSKALARTLFLLLLLLLVQLKLIQTSREMNNCRVRKASFSTPASDSPPASD